MNNYEKKYIKYKNKYINLKNYIYNQYGGDLNLNNTNINIPLLSYPLDNIKIDNYLKNIPDDIKLIITKILNNTKHISFNEFIENIKICIDKFENNINGSDFILYIHNPTKHMDVIEKKSNYWVSQIVYSLLRKKPLKIINDINDINHNHILICDDCIYSGTQMNQQLFEIKGNLPLKNIKSDIKLHLICPFICQGGFELLFKNQNINEKNIYINSSKIQYFKWKTILYTNNIIMKLLNILTKDEFEKIHINVFSGYNVAPIYFDHRIADDFSTLTNFYQLGFYNFKYYGSLLKNCYFPEIVNPVEYINKCPPIPYKDTKHPNVLSINIDNFSKIYGFNSEFTPYLDTTYDKDTGIRYIEL
jgi:hypothetical protein